MEIRKTTANDIDAIMDIFASAKCYMKANGNASQWDDNYPGRNTLDNDIANGNSYVFIDNGEVVGTFAFICGEDETYRVIENGAWRSDAPYGIVHRLVAECIDELGIEGKTIGIAPVGCSVLAAKVSYLRADTHENNRTMQSLLEAYGFQKCGTIHSFDGLALVAYDYIVHS
mgnify:CR=1 FL=1